MIYMNLSKALDQAFTCMECFELYFHEATIRMVHVMEGYIDTKQDFLLHELGNSEKFLFR
jgi:hypothetical protein